MNITTGFIQRAQRVVVYGPEGIGKSTFASRFPDPLFLDIEDGTGHLDVKRITGINSWSMLLSIVQQVRQEKPCKTLVIDTADAEMIRGKRMLIIDDVISTGESLRAMEELVAKAGGTVAGRMAVLAEGAAAKRDDITVLAPLPLFNADGTQKAL